MIVKGNDDTRMQSILCIYDGLERYLLTGICIYYRFTWYFPAGEAC